MDRNDPDDRDALEFELAENRARNMMPDVYVDDLGSVPVFAKSVREAEDYLAVLSHAADVLYHRQYWLKIEADAVALSDLVGVALDHLNSARDVWEQYLCTLRPDRKQESRNGQ